MKVSLVLEGGAMRGLYTAGVIDTFLKKRLMLIQLLVFQQELYLE